MTEPIVKEFRIGRSKLRHGLIVAGVAVAVGLGVMLFAGQSVPDREWVGALIMVLGAGLAVHAWRRQSTGAYLRVDRDGVYFREWGLTVPWSAIEDVYPTGARLQPFVAVKIRDPQPFLDALDEAGRRALRGNRLWKQPELKIPFNAVLAAPDEIIAAIAAGARDYR